MGDNMNTVQPIAASTGFCDGPGHDEIAQENFLASTHALETFSTDEQEKGYPNVAKAIKLEKVSEVTSQVNV
ncbi:hypothetical protein KIN20_017420 [Parelaphostrongylus tenuis]|uniref:Uncharacterized protein n=1 Tax=Parelaphostrongylus tenuis TaxID=148309 RepID=A0AAD5QTS4_PARTN|nr:hypothetical protein KIN20_017420 [Parelaphostrongylus tenuis]